MSGAPMPELIFVAGIQEGERAVLMGNLVLVGRSPSADVRLQEESVSREQLRFLLTGEGWVVENLSVNGTLVNGKRYKKNRKLLLDTGDVLGMGVGTEILYVAPGDDPEEALQAYRAKHPRIEPTAGAGAAAGSPPPLQKKGPPSPGAAPAAGAQAQTPGKSGEGGEEVEGRPETAPVPAAETGSRKLKYVLFCLVLGGVGFASMAIMLKPEKKKEGENIKPRLEANSIELALSEPLTRAPSPTRAVEELELARRMFPDRLRVPGDLFRCVKHYKLHLAYRGARTFSAIQDERDHAQAVRELVQQVKEKYDTAWKFERAESWQKARIAFEELRDVLAPGELEEQSEVYKVIYRNVMDHLGYVKWRTMEKKGR